MKQTHNTAVTKQWTAKWPYIANIVSEFHKVMVNKVTFVGFNGGGVDPPLTQWDSRATSTKQIYNMFMSNLYTESLAKTRQKIQLGGGQ